jgi:hypothetical protein
MQTTDILLTKDFEMTVYPAIRPLLSVESAVLSEWNSRAENQGYHTWGLDFTFAFKANVS